MKSQNLSEVISQLSTGELGFMITGVRNAIWSSIERELEPLDITAAQFVVFNSIAKGRGSTIGDLCRVLGYDSGAMTRLLDRIEKEGLLRRVANPDDRRSYLIELTEQSAALVPEGADAQVQAVFGELLKGFDEQRGGALKVVAGKDPGERRAHHLTSFAPAYICLGCFIRQDIEGCQHVAAHVLPKMHFAAAACDCYWRRSRWPVAPACVACTPTPTAIDPAEVEASQSLCGQHAVSCRLAAGRVVERASATRSSTA